MDHQDQEDTLATQAAPQRTPRDLETCGPVTKSVHKRLSEYSHIPIQTPDIQDSNSRHLTDSDQGTRLAPTTSSPPEISASRKGIPSGGWQRGCVVFAIITGVVFLVNLTFTVWAFVKHEADEIERVGTMYRGSCKTASRLNSVAHVFINVLSTVLLSGSNYTMQCLSSPNREEIDAAHKDDKVLDIGVISIRNIFRISRMRALMWCLLAISSIPLHFLYNSAVFSTSVSYEYIVWVTGESTVPTSMILDEKLEWKECIRAYGKEFMTDRRDVLIVISGEEGLDEYTEWSFEKYKPGAYEWICRSFMEPVEGFCDIKACMNADKWMIRGREVQYCLSQPMKERCVVQYSLYIMVAVLLCNAVKLACIILAVFGGRGSGRLERLVTIGDAIVSFVKYPDETTASVSIKATGNGSWGQVFGGTQRSQVPDSPYWYDAVGSRRWFLYYFMSIAVIGLAIMTLVNGYMQINLSSSASYWEKISFLWGLGIGTLSTRFMFRPFSFLSKSGQSLACVITANLPQVLFSFLYLIYNSIFTCMLLGKEWDEFSNRCRPLRVTRPEISVSTQRSAGGQRWAHPLLTRFCQEFRPARPTNEQGSTYFLQLPYRYSLPFMAVSGLLHWLISQSLFTTRFMGSDLLFAYPPDGPEPRGVDEYLSSQQVGWSPVGAFFTIVLLIFIFLVPIILGFQKYRGKIPLVGSCSAAISVVCQPLEVVDVTKSLKWGVVSTDDDGVGHCSFSNREVALPVSGKIYLCEDASKERMESGGS